MLYTLLKITLVFLIITIIGEATYYIYVVKFVQKKDTTFASTKALDPTPYQTQEYNENSCTSVYNAVVQAQKDGFVTSSIEIDNFTGKVKSITSKNGSIILEMMNDKTSYAYEYAPEIIRKTAIYDKVNEENTPIAFTDLKPNDTIHVEIKYDLLKKALAKSYGEGLISIVITREETIL